MASQPWHWVVIPMIGISMGEIFYLKDLADGLRGGSCLRIFFLRAAVADHQGGGIARQSHRNQIDIPGKVSGIWWAWLTILEPFRSPRSSHGFRTLERSRYSDSK